jgi:SpoVK/Ycf46/Vps4 family AAA+-type ATPase
MAARWLAQSLSLPLVTLDLSSVVSSYLGSSGRNIRSVLDYAKSGPCVLLLDEFDAIAKRRDDDSDIGELKRIVNVVLVELDRWPDTSLLVAATNHPQLLDPAVERRFDRVIELSLPGREERRAMLTYLSQGSATVEREVIELVADLTEGVSSSDLTRLWALCRRRAILQAVPVGDSLVREVARLTASNGAPRDRLILALHRRLGVSNRQVAELVGVSHPTVAAALKRMEERA